MRSEVVVFSDTALCLRVFWHSPLHSALNLYHVVREKDYEASLRYTKEKAFLPGEVNWRHRRSVDNSFAYIASKSAP